MEKEILSIRIGQRLRYFRQQRQLTLDALAEMTGVSKAMLGQIERGTSSPTVTTLWKITSGLQIPFTALVMENPSIELLQVAKQNVLFEDGERFEVYSTYARQGDPLEMFRVRLIPGCCHFSDPHGPGVTETITVFAGTLTMEVGGKSHTLQVGDAISFVDMDHIYQNISSEMCEVSMAMLYKTGLIKS